MNKIYTAGYSGHTPEQLNQAAVELNAIVVDIRRSPVSRIPGWNHSELWKLFGGGFPHYIVLEEWRNRNYKSGPIELVNAAAGLLKVLRYLKNHSVILLCGCAEYSGCHRRLCAELLHERGTETQELEWPDTGTGRVKAITIYQPWASLIAVGAKQIETRHWSTRYRGPLVIHAAKTKVGFESSVGIRSEYLRLTGLRYDADMPKGALLCVVDLVDCVPTKTLAGKISEQERAFGNYAPGRFGWILENVRVLPAPVPYRGRQGFFSVDAALLQLSGEIEIAAQELPRLLIELSEKKA